MKKLISQRRASKAYKIGGVFRKYYKYPHPDGDRYDKTIREGCFSRLFEKMGVNTPHYISRGFCEEEKMYYCDFDYIEMEPLDIKSKFTSEEFEQVLELLEYIGAADSMPGMEDDGYWVDKYVRENIAFAVKYIDEAYQADIKAIMKKIENCEKKEYVHGDFSWENVGIEKRTGKLIVFDFQYACVGVKNWDYAYFLGSLPHKCIGGLNIESDIEEMIRLVAAVKYGRAIRKKDTFDQTEFDNREKNFKFWWSIKT